MMHLPVPSYPEVQSHEGPARRHLLPNVTPRQPESSAAAGLPKQTSAGGCKQPEDRAALRRLWEDPKAVLQPAPLLYGNAASVHAQAASLR